ncbi:nuclear transport factor 2 family protein [Streptomyces sp. NPDC059828]|uniref:nuclear transport factor 2 family protein n=1 Tax=Streptomyces sp. NPDC059828 TaxID=3346965 RepID=UPI003647B219
MHPFRKAVESGDHADIPALLAEDVVFTSPVAFRPYQGKAMTTAILRGVIRVFEDFRYVREINGADGRDHALVFTARVGDREINGCDFLHMNEDGLIDDFMVMVRPLSAAQALAEAMGAQFDEIGREATALAEAKGEAGAEAEAEGDAESRASGS